MIVPSVMAKYAMPRHASSFLRDICCGRLQSTIDLVHRFSSHAAIVKPVQSLDQRSSVILCFFHLFQMVAQADGFIPSTFLTLLGLLSISLVVPIGLRDPRVKVLVHFLFFVTVWSLIRSCCGRTVNQHPIHFS